VQSNGVIFLDNGQQVFYNTSGQLASALWQYPVPTAAMQGYTLNTVADATSNLAAATYSYAFVQQIQLPQYGGTINQTTTPLYVNSTTGAFLYSITTNGMQDVQISGNFAGTTSDGYPYVTQIYRQSTNVAVFYLVATLTANVTYTDTSSDQTIASNQQLTIDNDQPPTGLVSSSGFALNPIESFQDRMWVLARVQNAATNNLPQTQLWYSRLGLPWSFDAALQVLLVGDESTLVRTGTIGVSPIYGNNPSALAKIGSNLLVFETLSTSMVYGTDQSNYVVLPLFADIGCIAPLSVVKGNGLVFWLSAEGVFSYDGSSLQYLSDDIYNELQRWTPNVLRAATGSYADQTYCLSLPGAPITYEFYIPSKKWTTVPYGTNGFVYGANIPNDVTGLTAPIGGKFNQIAAIELGTYAMDFWFDGPQNLTSSKTTYNETDLGLPITVTWTGPVEDCGDEDQAKDFLRLSISAPPQAVQATVTLAVDPGFPNSPPPFTYTFDLSKGPTTQTVAIPQGSNVGTYAQLSISAVNATLPNQLGVVTPTNASIQIWSVRAGGVMKRSWQIAS
jgi:hypothetical protein